MLLSSGLKKHEKPCFSTGRSHTFDTLFQDVSAIKIRLIAAQRIREIKGLTKGSNGSAVKSSSGKP
jgi:hypothetical protein